MAEQRGRDNELGALWRRQGKNGPFLSGEIDGQPVIVFPVTNKKNPKMPDFRVLRGNPRPQPKPQPAEDPFLGGGGGSGYDEDPFA